MSQAVLEEGVKAPEPDAVQRRRIGQLGMWIFIASELLFFDGLFFAYAHARLSAPAGFAEAGRHTDVRLGTLNTAVLLTCSLCGRPAEARRPAWLGRFPTAGPDIPHGTFRKTA